MEPILNNWFEIVTVASLTAVMAMAINQKRASYRKRAQELEAASQALSAHYDAVNKLVNDPAFPVTAKEWLVVFTEAISRREVAQGLAQAFCDGSLFKVKPTSDKLLVVDEVNRLYQSRPDLVEAYHTAISSGIAALFLRWPENSANFQRMVVALASDNRKERALTSKLSDLAKKLFENDNGGNDRPDHFNRNMALGA